MPPERTTWRARTEDVRVTLRDVLKRSAVESLASETWLAKKNSPQRKRSAKR